MGLTDSVEEHDTDLRWCHSNIQLADGMTKKKKMSCRILSLLRTPRWKLVLDTTYTSSKKRSRVGVNPLDELSQARRHNHHGLLMLFHSIGHGILADTRTDRPLQVCWVGSHYPGWQNTCPRKTRLKTVDETRERRGLRGFCFAVMVRSRSFECGEGQATQGASPGWFYCR